VSAAAVPVVAEPTFDADVEARRRDGDADYASGWYCVRTDPFSCPALGCGFVAHYMTGAHRIVVWPRIDDPTLFANARDAKDVGRNPRIIEYHPDFGPCIAWDEYVRIGRPIHGRLDRPDGWEDRPSRL
jgi:hypothetical protein